MISSNLKVENPTKQQILAGFKSLGYKITQTYYEAFLWKTNAPPAVVYDVFKTFKAQREGESDNVFKNCKEGSIAHKILSLPVVHKPDFEFKEEVVENKQKLLRKYFTPTEPNWGPKPRATGAKREKEEL